MLERQEPLGRFLLHVRRRATGFPNGQRCGSGRHGTRLRDVGCRAGIAPRITGVRGEVGDIPNLKLKIIRRVVDIRLVGTGRLGCRYTPIITSANKSPVNRRICSVDMI
jgi:hypothetical protein